MMAVDIALIPRVIHVETALFTVLEILVQKPWKNPEFFGFFGKPVVWA